MTFVIIEGRLGEGISPSAPQKQSRKLGGVGRIDSICFFWVGTSFIWYNTPSAVARCFFFLFLTTLLGRHWRGVHRKALLAV